MSVVQWLDQEKMVQFLQGVASTRKLRLFLCACCRRVAHHLTHPLTLPTVETAERYADGLATDAELNAAREALQSALAGRGASRTGVGRQWMAREPFAPDALALLAVDARAASPLPDPSVLFGRVGPALTLLMLEEVFGYPRKLVPVVPEWLTWSGGVVQQLAHAIYQERRFADLPVLADALEEAGCTNAEILSHCRQANQHVRGCWLLDLLTGRS